ncbi:MAG: hypothetical protein ACRC6H_09735 [Culicoidibacterales bacterium]
MTNFAKIQALYKAILPEHELTSEAEMSEELVDFYQAAGFMVLDIEEIFLKIAFYDYEPITDNAGARRRLYREVVGYGLIADSKLKTTPVEEQEAEILAYYQQQGVQAASYEQLLRYFPWSQTWLGRKHPKNDKREDTHKLF